MDAALEERAERRFLELKATGRVVNFEETLREMAERDDADSRRALSPLRPAEGAFRCDTTGLSIEEVLKKIIIEAIRIFEIDVGENLIK